MLSSLRIKLIFCRTDNHTVKYTLALKAVGSQLAEDHKKKRVRSLQRESNLSRKLESLMSFTSPYITQAFTVDIAEKESLI